MIKTIIKLRVTSQDSRNILAIAYRNLGSEFLYNYPVLPLESWIISEESSKLPKKDYRILEGLSTHELLAAREVAQIIITILDT